jgi:hypothetical protein
VLKVTESDETTVKLESDAESITRLQDMMSYQPDYFVGRYVYKYFEASKSKEVGVFMNEATPVSRTVTTQPLSDN